MEHKFGISCLKSGSVFCRVILDHGGYVPGETILISAIIRNRSKIHMKSTKASLREVSTIGKVSILQVTYASCLVRLTVSKP